MPFDFIAPRTPRRLQSFFVLLKFGIFAGGKAFACLLTSTSRSISRFLRGKHKHDARASAFSQSTHSLALRACIPLVDDAFVRNITTVFVLTVFILAVPAWGQLPRTQLNSLFPAGAQAGTSVEVQLQGEDFESTNELLCSHPGLQATAVVADSDGAGSEQDNGKYRIRVAKDVPPGFYDIRACGRFGVSNPRIFHVGELPETTVRGHHDPQHPATLSVNQTINGRVQPEKRDYFSVKLTEGDRVLIECLAERLDSRLNGALTLFAPDGREVARSNDVLGLDPLLDYTAPTAGVYLLALSDFLYRGGDEFYYRLRCHEGPHIDFVFPPAVLPGTTADVTYYGRMLPGGSLSDFTLDGVRLEERSVVVEAPARDLTLPPNVSAGRVGPSAAFQDRFRDRTDWGRHSFYFAEAPVTVEQEPNDRTAEAQEVHFPCEIVGQFYPARDVDSFIFTAHKGEVLQLDLLAHRLGQPIDPRLVVEQLGGTGGEQTASDANGKRIANVDDSQDRARRIGSDFDTSTDDPSHRLTIPADGRYRVTVWDQFGTAIADPRRTYRLVVRPPRPDFRLVAVPLPAQSPVNPNAVLLGLPGLRQGGTAAVQIEADRRGGFSGAIEVFADELPAGVRCRPTTVAPGATTASLLFEAAPDAEACAGAVRINGKALIDGAPVVRAAATGTAVWGTGNRQQDPPSFRVTGDLVMGVIAEPAAASIDVPNQTFVTSRGGELTIPVTVARSRGFGGELKLVSIGLPKTLKPADVTVKGDAETATVEISVKNNRIKPGEYSFHLRADAQAKLVRDPVALEAAERRKAVLQKRLEDLRKRVETGDSAQPSIDLAKAELERVETELAAAEREFAEIKKANPAKNVRFAVFSPTVRLRIVATPLEVMLGRESISLPRGKETELPVSIERRFRFAEQVSIAAEIPSEAKGITCQSLELATDQSRGILKFAAAADASPGSYQVKLHFRGQLNKIDFDEVAILEVNVN